MIVVVVDPDTQTAALPVHLQRAPQATGVVVAQLHPVLDLTSNGVWVLRQQRRLFVRGQLRS